MVLFSLLDFARPFSHEKIGDQVFDFLARISLCGCWLFLVGCSCLSYLYVYWIWRPFSWPTTLMFLFCYALFCSLLSVALSIFGKEGGREKSHSTVPLASTTLVKWSNCGVGRCCLFFWRGALSAVYVIQIHIELIVYVRIVSGCGCGWCGVKCMDGRVDCRTIWDGKGW